MLGANQSPQVGIADKCLQEVGIELTGKDTFHKNDVGIFFGTPDWQLQLSILFDAKGKFLSFDPA